MLMQSDPSYSLVFECDFEEPPEKVWRALTEPQLLEAWLTDDSMRTGRNDSTRTEPDDAEAARRQPFSAPQRVQGRVGSSRYEILTAEPHRLLRYGWQDRESGEGEAGGREVHSVVTVELAPGELGGTHLRLTHGAFTIVPAAMNTSTTASTTNTASATTSSMTTTSSSTTAHRVIPITSARQRRTPIVSCATQSLWRRAA